MRGCRLLSRLTSGTKERGSSLVEMALVVPVLLSFFIGVTEIGRLLYFKLSLDHIASQGAKFASRVSGMREDCGVSNIYDQDLTPDMSSAHWATQRMVHELLGVTGRNVGADIMPRPLSENLVSISTNYVGTNDETCGVSAEHRNTVGVDIAVNYAPLLFPDFAMTMHGSAQAPYLYNVGNTILVRQAMSLPERNGGNPAPCADAIAKLGKANALSQSADCASIALNPRWGVRMNKPSGDVLPSGAAVTGPVDDTKLVNPGDISPVGPLDGQPADNGLISDL